MAVGVAAASVATAVTVAAPVLLAGTGELLAETTGVFNIGVEGCMLVGALASIIVAHDSGNIPLALVVGAVAGVALGFVFGIMAVALRASVVLSGLGILFLAGGLTSMVGNSYVDVNLKVTLKPVRVPWLSHLPFLGDALFRQEPTTYLAFAVALLAAVLLRYTQTGINMRAVGAGPGTADAIGVSVVNCRMIFVCVGGACAGLAGGMIALGSIFTWVPELTGGAGFIALALVIFSGWKPGLLVLGALLYGGLGTLGDLGQVYAWPIPSEVFSAMPYLGTLIVVTGVSWWRLSRTGVRAWPAGLGLPFFRGQD
jgi:simple sugar transport system permease protein